jgi:radical SAM superfamily enzyme YgiQ (UPF0313 family)
MARALLIKTPKCGARAESVAVNLEPLGLMYIAAFVRAYSAHWVGLIDAQAEAARVEQIAPDCFRMGMPEELLRSRIRAAAPRVVGISALFEMQEREVVATARLVKAIAPDIVVVIGGLDAGVRYREYLRCGAVDLVVRGDGEETFLDILDRVERGDSLTGIPGTCESAGVDECRVNRARVRRVPFDAYPFPDRESLPRELYANASTQRTAFPFAREAPAILLQGSRGCRLRCAFCDIVAVQDQWNAHSPEYIVREIAHCVERYGAREIVFVDDNFMLDKRWAARVFELVAERGLRVSVDIMAGIAVWTLSEAMIETMIRAGVYRVCLPIESGNPSTLAFIKKPVNLDKAFEMIDYCNRRGLYTFANLIVGFPFENEADIQRTIAWGDASGLDAIHYFIATPLPGARMYPIYEENGWLTRSDAGGVSWRTAHFTRAQLEAFAVRASRAYVWRRLRFYAHPIRAARYLVPKLASLRKLRYALKLARHMVPAGWTKGARGMPAATSRDDAVVLSPIAQRRGGAEVLEG